jgi:hypothetical protein
MRLSGKDKAAPLAVAKPPAQAGEALDGLRSALFRNDCLVQAFVLAEVVDNTTLAAAPDVAAVRAMPPPPPGPGEAATEMKAAREWLAGLEQSQSETREGERREAEEKLAVLREEHRTRVEDRRRIMEAALMARLDAEHVAFK